jgi:hypothetical protein
VKRIPNYVTAFLILLSLAPCPAQTNAATATKTSPKVKEHPQPQELYGPVIAANNHVRRYLPVCVARTMGPGP